ESSIFKVVRIIKMRGRGVFNPLAKCQNTKLMTIKDFICAHRIECGYNIENYIFELTPVKVEKVND
ncbi:MAG: hypothetical protein II047_08355, partial [Bacteroidales bacterium]|nr:hypothetical protein [Bacteroidales bacterium]